MAQDESLFHGLMNSSKRKGLEKEKHVLVPPAEGGPEKPANPIPGVDTTVSEYPDGPRTFKGTNLSERTLFGFATDGSMSRYVMAMALKGYFEFQTSSPESLMIDAELSKWTTRTWTYNIKSAQNYVKAYVLWLSLDWAGQRWNEKSTRIPWLASENAELGFEKLQMPGGLQPGPE